LAASIRSADPKFCAEADTLPSAVAASPDAEAATNWRRVMRLLVMSR
jgi:hypothetical protein